MSNQRLGLGGMRLTAWWLGCAVLLTMAACDGGKAIAPDIEALATPSSDLVYTWGPYELVGSDDWASTKITATHTIGPEGGRILLGLDELVVPRGAVQSQTVFKMTRQLGRHIVVDLKAHDRRTGAVVDTFQQPLELKLSYRFTRLSQADMHRLVVLWLKDERSDGELIPMPTSVVTRTRQVVGTLTHFSQYAMGMN
jgi:hypothetical protein